MANISSQAAGKLQNKEKTFQGQKFDDDLGVDWYSFKYRNHDAQIGRFIEIDPLAEDYVYNSTYAFSENKVTSHIELEGLESLSLSDFWRAGGISSSTDPKQFVKDVGKELTKPKTWFEGYAAAGQIVGPLALTAIMTGGLGGGVVLEAEVSSLRAATTEAAEVSLAERAKEIHGALSVRTQNTTTTAVASATTSEGQSTTLVGFSEKNLRKPQMAVLKPGEVAVTGKGHAEVTILNHASANGMKVNAVAASRPICSGCATAINNAGAVPASPLKINIQPAVAVSTYIKPPIIQQIK